MKNDIFSDVDAYIGNLMNAPDEVLTKTEAAIEASGIPLISISANQGKFLHLLARLTQPKKFLK